MIKVWFESHATSLDNEAKVASGWNDVDLSGLGIRQAQELLERNRLRKLDAVFCSDLQRAVKTAIPTINALSLPLYIDERLRECNYGDFTQQPKDKVEAERIKRIAEPFPGGESYNQCISRMRGFFDWLKADFQDKTVLIIGHRATHYAVEHLALGKSLEDCVAEHWQWQPGWEYEI